MVVAGLDSSMIRCNENSKCPPPKLVRTFFTKTKSVVVARFVTSIAFIWLFEGIDGLLFVYIIAYLHQK